MSSESNSANVNLFGQRPEGPQVYRYPNLVEAIASTVSLLSVSADKMWRAILEEFRSTTAVSPDPTRIKTATQWIERRTVRVQVKGHAPFDITAFGPDEQRNYAVVITRLGPKRPSARVTPGELRREMNNPANYPYQLPALPPTRRSLRSSP